jgi:hypothetical protein
MPNIINYREIFPWNNCVSLLRNFIAVDFLSPLGFPKRAVAVGYVMVMVVWGTARRRVWNTPHTTMLRINTLHSNNCGKNNTHDNNNCGKNQQHPEQQQLQ